MGFQPFAYGWFTPNPIKNVHLKWSYCTKGHILGAYPLKEAITYTFMLRFLSILYTIHYFYTIYMEVSVNGDTPSSRPYFILGFSIINQPLGGSSIYGNPHVYITSIILCDDLYHIHYISYYLLSISVIYHHKYGIISSIYIYIYILSLYYLYIISILSIYYIYLHQFYILYYKLSMTLYHHDPYLVDIYIYILYVHSSPSAGHVTGRWPSVPARACGSRDQQAAAAYLGGMMAIQ